MGVLQKAGAGSLETVRHNTFHYPAPKDGYEPSSDETLADTLRTMTKRGVEYHLNGDTRAITLTFADDIALAMAMGTQADDDLRRRAELARDGALAFHTWSTALIDTYVRVSGFSVGEPR